MVNDVPSKSSPGLPPKTLWTLLWFVPRGLVAVVWPRGFGDASRKRMGKVPGAMTPEAVRAALPFTSTPRNRTAGETQKKIRPWKAELKHHEPDLVVVMFGANEGQDQKLLLGTCLSDALLSGYETYIQGGKKCASSVTSL